MNSRNYTILNRLGAGSNPSSGESGTIVIDCPMLDEGLTAGHVRRIVEASTSGKTVMLRFSDGDGMTGTIIPTMAVNYGGFIYIVYIQMETQCTAYMGTIDMLDDDMAISEDMSSTATISDTSNEYYELDISTLRQIEEALSNGKIVNIYVKGQVTTSVSIDGEYSDKTITLMFDSKILKYRCNLGDDDGSVITPEVITLGESKPPIIDLEELPKAGWKGTTVPNTGYVENVYINTKLSNEEVVGIVKNLNYDFNNDDYYVFVTGDIDNPFEVCLYCVENDDGSTYCSIYLMNTSSNEWVDIFDTENGWYDFDNPIVFNGNALDGSAEGFLWGEQNALLSALFSTTPFEKVGLDTVDPNYFYRTPDNTIYQLTSKTTEGEMKWSGTSVPTNGYIDRIYVNVNLDAEEVADILRTIHFNEVEESGSTYYVYYMIKNGSNDFKCEWIPSHLNENGKDSFMVYSNNFTRDAVFTYNWSGYRFDGFHSFFNQTQEYIDLGTNVSYVEEDVEYPAGSQNDLLSPLFSTTLPEKKAETVVVKEFEQISKPAIIDVEELPSTVGKWVGTPLPAHGFIDKVYFNKNLTKEETLAILDSVQTNGDYHFAKNNNYNVSAYSGYHLGYSRSSGYDFVCLFDPSGTYGGDGWADNCPEYVELQFEADEYSEYGKFNEQLSSLVSSTPFEYVQPNIDPNCLYRTPDNSIHQLATKDVISYTGTTVNNTGNVSTVYFNDKLSLFETTSLLMKLDYVATPFLDNPIAPLLFSSSGSPVIFAVQTDDGYEINVSTNIANGVFDRIFIDYEFAGDMPGWYMNSYNVNSSVISNYQGIPVGAQNELLSSLFSIAPFESVVEKVKEFKEINKPNIVYINAASETGTFTNEEIELLKGDNTIIVAETNVPGLATIEMIFRKAMYYDVPDIGLLLYENVSGGLFAPPDISFILIDPSINIWEQQSSGTMATLNDIRKIELYQDEGSIDLRFVDFDGMTHYLGSVPVEKQIGNSSYQNALVTHDAVKEYAQPKITVTENEDGTVDITIPTGDEN